MQQRLQAVRDVLEHMRLDGDDNAVLWTEIGGFVACPQLAVIAPGGRLAQSPSALIAARCAPRATTEVTNRR